MSNLQPWREKGVLVSSPQIVWNLTWMAEFMSGIQQQGADVDFMAIHYYGSWNDTKTPQTYIKNVYKTYGKKIWITELGTTQSSNGTQKQQIAFMNTMLNWTSNQTYIDRVVWSGAWSVDSPPDGYIAVQDGMFYSNATLRTIGQEYAAFPNATVTSSSTSSMSSSTSTSTSTSTLTKTSSSTSSSTKTSSSSTFSPAPKTTSQAATTTSSSTSYSTSSSAHSVTATSTSKATLIAKTSSSTMKVTSTAKTSSSSKKTTSTTKKTSSSSSKHHKHHSTTTSTAKAAQATSTSKCRVLVGINKGNIVSESKRQEQEEKRMMMSQ